MTAGTTVVVHRDATMLAAAAAARLVTRLVDVLAARETAHLVLTGGSTGIGVLEAVRESPARAAVDWPRVHLWWGDERFLPAGHPDRNETQAREALLDHVPVDEERVHPMPAAGARVGGADPESSAAAYARVLAEHAHPEDHGASPVFDVLLLGLGPDAHIASLFPEHPALQAEDLGVVGVRGSPKPPPERVSLTLPTIRRAADVWVAVAGADKAAAVALSLGEAAGERQAPAAGAVGRRSTLWLLDRAAAGHLPPGLARPASP